MKEKEMDEAELDDALDDLGRIKMAEISEFALNFDWKDKKIDFDHCLEILQRYHPSGTLTLIQEHEFYKKDGEDMVRIRLNPALCEIIRYYTHKYGQKLGWKVYLLYFQLVFGPNFFNPSLD